jgi:bifunctional non-homologous end joining protein LigD
MLPGSGRPVGHLEAWAAEPKFDGRRALVTISGGAVRVVSRNGRHLTGAVPELRALARRGVEAMLDGELVAGSGRLDDFYRLSGRLQSRSRPERLHLVAFDVLWLDGTYLVNRPYVERRAVLENLEVPGIILTPSYSATELDALLERCEESGMEGVVLKRLRSVYRPGRRSSDWCQVRGAAWPEHARRRRQLHAVRG